MAFRFLAEDFDRYIKKGKPGDGGRHIWDDFLDLLRAKFGVRFSPTLGNPGKDWLDTLWLAPKGSTTRTWTNQAQFVLARSIVEKKLRYGLSVECAPLPDSEQPDSVVDRDGWRLLSELNDQDFKRQIDEF